MDELQWKRVVRANIEKSKADINRVSNDFFIELDDLCYRTNKILNENRNQISDKISSPETASIVVMTLLLRYTGHWSTRLCDICESGREYDIQPSQLKNLIHELFDELFDDEVEQSKKTLKDLSENFVEVLDKSRLTKVKKNKNEVLQQQMKRFNDKASKLKR